MRKILFLMVNLLVILLVIVNQNGMCEDKKALLIEMKSIEENIEKETKKITEWINEFEKELIKWRKLLEEKSKKWDRYTTFLNNCMAILKSISQKRRIKVEAEIAMIETLKKMDPCEELVSINETLIELSLIKSKIESNKEFHYLLNLVAERKNEKEIREWIEKLKIDLEELKKMAAAFRQFPNN